MHFGYNTRDFVLLLTRAENITLKQSIAMQDFITDETIAAYKSAERKLAAYNLPESMLIRQTLGMYSDHYPQAVIISALGVASRHVITQDEYEVLTAPWAKVIGTTEPVAA